MNIYDGRVIVDEEGEYLPIILEDRGYSWGVYFRNHKCIRRKDAFDIQCKGQTVAYVVSDGDPTIVRMASGKEVKERGHLAWAAALARGLTEGL